MTTPCVEFAGAVNNSGYGSIAYNGGWIGAHVKAFIDRYGPVPSGHVVMHRCDNRRCINADHLTSGTQKDNLQDARSKGRLVRKLTSEQVKAIRSAYTGKWGEQAALAREFGVSQNMVNKIVHKARHQ